MENLEQLKPARDPHKTVRVKVWADVDEGIADLVLYLNTIEGVTTDASCQGTIGEGGPAPYRAQVMAHWAQEAEPRLRAEFDVALEGECWGYIHPREGWKAPTEFTYPTIPDYLIDPIVFKDANLGTAMVAMWHDEQWVFAVHPAGQWVTKRRVNSSDPLFIEPIERLSSGQ